MGVSQSGVAVGGDCGGGGLGGKPTFLTGDADRNIAANEQHGMNPL